MSLSIVTKHTPTAMFVAAMVFATPQAALALEPSEVMDRFASASNMRGQSFTYDKIEGDASGFTVTGVAFASPGLSSVKIATMAFSGVSENDNGTIGIEKITTGEISGQIEEVQFVFEDSTLDQATLPAKGETDPIAGAVIYRNAQMGRGVFKNGDTEVAVFGNSILNLSPFTDAAPVTFDLSMTGISVDMRTLADPQAKAMFEQLGYSGQFTGKLVVDGSWSLANGDMEISTYDIIIDDVGTLGIAFKIGGYTKEVLAKIQAASVKAEENPNDTEAQQAVFSELSNLTLKGATISFSDSGLTDRGLDVASKQMGQPKDSLVASAPLMIGLGMGQLQMPQLTEMVSMAVAEFLKSKGTISASVTPESALPFTQIGTAGLADPKSLVDLLKLSINAK